VRKRANQIQNSNKVSKSWSGIFVIQMEATRTRSDNSRLLDETGLRSCACV